jgi:hypothetical protein
MFSEWDLENEVNIAENPEETDGSQTEKPDKRDFQNNFQDENRCDFQYAAPENDRNQRCTISDDVFSFKKVLFEICTGKAVFPTQSDRERTKFDVVNDIRP